MDWSPSRYMARLKGRHYRQFSPNIFLEAQIPFERPTVGSLAASAGH
jgi:hypothetical protein